MTRHTCPTCGKERDSIEMIERQWFKDDLDGGRTITESVCIDCLATEASQRELFPDSDNLILCPRCKDQEIVRTQAVCHSCREEISAWRYG